MFRCIEKHSMFFHHRVVNVFPSSTSKPSKIRWFRCFQNWLLTFGHSSMQYLQPQIGLSSPYFAASRPYFATHSTAQRKLVHNVPCEPINRLLFDPWSWKLNDTASCIISQFTAAAPPAHAHWPRAKQQTRGWTTQNPVRSGAYVIMFCLLYCYCIALQHGCNCVRNCADAMYYARRYKSRTFCGPSCRWCLM